MHGRQARILDPWARDRGEEWFEAMATRPTSFGLAGAGAHDAVANLFFDRGEGGGVMSRTYGSVKETMPCLQLQLR
jgi:hypothetical protein